jgi:hypothetical protein
MSRRLKLAAPAASLSSSVKRAFGATPRFLHFKLNGDVTLENPTRQGYGCYTGRFVNASCTIGDGRYWRLALWGGKSNSKETGGRQ